MATTYLLPLDLHETTLEVPEVVLTVVSTFLGALNATGRHFPTAGVVVEDALMSSVSSQFDDRFQSPHAGDIVRADRCRFVGHDSAIT